MNFKPVILVLLLLLSVAPFGAGATPPERAVHALRVVELNTKPFLCDGTNHTLDSGLHEVRLRKAIVWFGAYGYTNADIIFTFERVSANGEMQSIAKAGWDHYAEPTGVAGQLLTYDFTPDWIEIAAGETLELFYSCNPMDEASKTKKAHLIAFVYFWGREQ